MSAFVEMKNNGHRRPIFHPPAIQRCIDFASGYLEDVHGFRTRIKCKLKLDPLLRPELVLLRPFNDFLGNYNHVGRVFKNCLGTEPEHPKFQDSSLDFQGISIFY